jgi:hypothetical protein
LGGIPLTKLVVGPPMLEEDGEVVCVHG